MSRKAAENAAIEKDNMTLLITFSIIAALLIILIYALILYL